MLSTALTAAPLPFASPSTPFHTMPPASSPASSSVPAPVDPHMWSMCPDFGRPGRFELLVISWMSLVVSMFFWAVESYVAARDCIASGEISTGIIQNTSESLLDFVSTVVVLWRLWPEDSLDPTPRNHMIEARAGVMIEFCMIALAGIFIGFACYNLGTFEVENDSQVLEEGVLSAPSALLYLLVGMMQLQASWAMRMRSMRQDAIISIMGCFVAMGSFVSSLANLSECAAERPQRAARSTAPAAPACSARSAPTCRALRLPRMPRAPSPPCTHSPMDDVSSKRRWVTVGKRIAGNVTESAEIVADAFGENVAVVSHDASLAEAARIHYRYWWLSDVAAIVTATILLFFGLFYLYEDSCDGSRWWTVSWWCDPLPPKEMEKKDKPTEQTPLKALPA